jgi:hypothetical protein
MVLEVFGLLNNCKSYKGSNLILFVDFVGLTLVKSLPCNFFIITPSLNKL